jgi:hypothetical protein
VIVRRGRVVSTDSSLPYAYARLFAGERVGQERGVWAASGFLLSFSSKTGISCLLWKCLEAWQWLVPEPLVRGHDCMALHVGDRTSISALWANIVMLGICRHSGAAGSMPVLWPAPLCDGDILHLRVAVPVHLTS